jgi:hypothetical protein
VHAFGDEGALKEQRRILVFRCRRAIMNARKVGGELGLLERAFEHVFVGDGDFTPWFETHVLLSH